MDNISATDVHVLAPAEPDDVIAFSTELTDVELKEVAGGPTINNSS